MNKEIKEILNDLDYCKNRERGNISLKSDECDELLNYITNLQEENEKLKSKMKFKEQCLNEFAKRINKIIKEINDYEEDYYEEPSVIVNKRDRKDKWDFEEYQANILQIANGDYKKYENENKINKAIEYIELKRGKNKSSYDCEILNILRGEDNE